MNKFLIVIVFTFLAFGDCVQSRTGRTGKFIDTRETSFFAVHSFVEWNDSPGVIDKSYYPDELSAC